MGVFVAVHHPEVIKGKPYAEGRKILQCNNLGDEATCAWPPAVRLFATLLPNTRRAARSSPPFLFHFPASSPKAYWHFGSPSLPAGASDVDPMKMEQVLVVLTLVMLAVQPSAVVLMTGSVLPVDRLMWHKSLCLRDRGINAIPGRPRVACFARVRADQQTLQRALAPPAVTSRNSAR